eukprot:9343516-Prorocentrum_lima.AAC.1
MAPGAWPGQSGKRLGGLACWLRTLGQAWLLWLLAGAPWIGGKQRGAANLADIHCHTRITFIIGQS